MKICWVQFPTHLDVTLFNPDLMFNLKTLQKSIIMKLDTLVIFLHKFIMQSSRVSMRQLAKRTDTSKTESYNCAEPIYCIKAQQALLLTFGHAVTTVNK